MDMKRFIAAASVVAVVYAANVLAADSIAPLADAAKKGDRTKIVACLKIHPDVNQPQVDGMTALHWAVYHEDYVTAGELMDAGANVEAENRYGVKPLSIACMNGNKAIVELLLASGADANTTMRGGETVLMTAARTGKLEPVQALLAHGAKVNAKERKGQTALMWAAAEGHAAVVNELLNAGADFRISLKSGFSPFFFAVREGQMDVVLTLLAAGIDVNQGMGDRRRSGKTRSKGTSPLMLAVENGHFELASSLLDAGADPNDKRGGATALHAITWVRKPIRGDGDPPPAGSGSMDSLQFVRNLVAHGANVDARHGARAKDSHGRLNKSDATPFLLASETADVPLMKLLVELGANPTLTNADSCPPLLAAAGVGVLGDGDEAAGTEAEAIEAIRFLLKLGADVNAVEDNGETAMHGAAYKSWTKLVKFLSENGADPNVWNRKNRRGWTPLKIAQGHRPGNFRPSEETIDAIENAMPAAGVEPPR